jgi:hypothetical protein
MDTLKPIVVTAKKAEDHLNKIKVEHSDMLQGMNDQSLRVTQLKSERDNQKQVADQEQKASKMESDKANLDGQARILEQQNKAQELAIKQQALSLW